MALLKRTPAGGGLPDRPSKWKQIKVMKSLQCLDCDAKLEVARFPIPETQGERAKCPRCKGVLPARDGADLLRYRLVSLPTFVESARRVST